jgi:phage gp37-like protein
MKAATIHQLKDELGRRSAGEMKEIILRLARYKVENKELLTYLLLEADDEESYIGHIKDNIDEQLETINTFNTYYAKKGMRRVARYVQKWVRYSGQNSTEAEIRTYFCQRLRQTDFPVRDSRVMLNMYRRQLERVEKAVSSLHEDLQYDYLRELEELRL